jgi:hypothetical protein
MLKTLPLSLSLAFFSALAAGPALADSGWDHRSLRSHRPTATDRAEPELAPGERRVGRIVIGAPAASPGAAVPETLQTTTQRQWNDGPLSGNPVQVPWSSREISSRRHNGTHGASHSSPGR